MKVDIRINDCFVHLANATEDATHAFQVLTERISVLYPKRKRLPIVRRKKGARLLVRSQRVFGTYYRRKAEFRRLLSDIKSITTNPQIYK